MMLSVHASGPKNEGQQGRVIDFADFGFRPGPFAGREGVCRRGVASGERISWRERTGRTSDGSQHAGCCSST